ncbi:hypothetical protein IPZ61_03395 [Streptomyces sioyaensis]|uniref:hypothetical protein n=1 Tax=Streptomyces sioyaensis TaxID=67364 RepID=UPI001F3C63BF|nr:hypothetical protein [Streptomyces sioyaensis]MCF3172371.1 hypothetical protein [Streptomyces sioyaensis]
MPPIFAERELDAIFPKSERQALFAEAASKAESREEIQNALSDLAKPPPFAGYLEDSAENIWRELLPDVSRHVDCIRARDELREQLRSSVLAPEHTAALQGSYEDISRQVDAVRQDLDKASTRLSAVESRLLVTQSGHRIIDVARAMIEAECVDLVTEELMRGIQSRRPQRAADLARLKSEMGKGFDPVRLRINQVYRANACREEYLRTELEKVRVDVHNLRGAERDLLIAKASVEVQVSSQIDQLIRLDPAMRRLESELSRSRNELIDALIEKGMLPHLWKAIDGAREEPYELILPTAVPGLPEQPPEHYIRTEAWERVENLIDARSARGLSLGISGPRGAGKTTLLESVCQGRALEGSLGIAIPAPVDYAPHDFVLHMMGTLCRKVIDRFGSARRVGIETLADFQRSWTRSLTWSVIGAATLTLCSVFALALHGLQTPTMDSTAWATGLLAAAGAASGVWWDARALATRLISDRSAAVEAASAIESTVRGRAGQARWLLRLSGMGRLHRILSRLTAVAARFARPPVLVIAALGSGAALLILLSQSQEKEMFRAAVAAVCTLLLLASFRFADQLVYRRREGVLADFVMPERVDRQEPGSELLELLLKVGMAAVMRHVLIATAVLLEILLLWGLHATDLPFSARLAGEVFPGAVAAIALIYGYELRERMVELGNEIPYSEPPGYRERLAQEAAERLELVEYQLSYTYGLAATLLTSKSLPVGGEVQRKREYTAQRRLITFPELISSYREFAERVADVEPLIIGIDEIDKMPTGDVAQTFLNSLKGIFGTRNSYYLVSVSEDASADFERRGIPFRSTFDSCFDEVVSLGYLNFETAQDMLAMRPPSMTRPAQGLCYCLAGGLAREIVRFQRQLSQLGRDLPSGAKWIVGRGLDAQVDAALISVRGESRSIAQSVQSICRLLRVTQPTSGALLSFCKNLRTPSPLSASLLRRVRPSEVVTHRTGADLIAFVYFSATVLEFFDENLTKERAERAERGPTTARYDQLAAARQAFSVGALEAWHRVSEFRRAWGMKTLA